MQGIFEHFQDKQIPVTVHELLIGIPRFYYFMSIFYICILPKKGTFFPKLHLLLSCLVYMTDILFCKIVNQALYCQSVFCLGDVSQLLCYFMVELAQGWESRGGGGCDWALPLWVPNLLQPRIIAQWLNTLCHFMGQFCSGFETPDMCCVVTQTPSI